MSTSRIDEAKREAAMQIMRMLGHNSKSLVVAHKKLAEYFMIYIFERSDESIYTNIWECLRNTVAKTYWFRTCIKAYGLEWSLNKLSPTEEEKTDIMSEILGAHDVE